MFKPGLYKHKSGIVVKVDENGDTYIKSNNIPMTLRTSEIFDSEMWEEVEVKNGSKNT